MTDDLLTRIGAQQSAISTDIGHAERILGDRRSSDGEWHDDTDPVLCDLIDDMCDTMCASSALLAEVVEKPPAADPALLAAANRALVEEVDTLRAEVLAATMRYPSETCRTLHTQLCSGCDRIDCCDNTSPAKSRIEELERDLASARRVESGYHGTVRELSALVLLRERERDSTRALARTLLACARSGDVIPQDLPEWLEEVNRG